MAKGFLYGNGGSSGNGDLNFQIVGGTTAPSDPKENDIWVNTDRDIPEWVFSSDDPLYFGELYDPITIKEGCYLNAEGKELTGSAFFTAVIAIPKNTGSISVKMGTTETSVCHIFYDNSGNILSIVKRETGTHTYDAPKGAKTLRMSIHNNDGTPSVIAFRSAESAQNMVWFSIGANGSIVFDALKKNGIQIHPLSAQQCVNGTWVGVTAKSYQGGKWVDWIKYLYNAGDECTSITGGWEAVAAGTSDGRGAPTITKAAGTMKVLVDQNEIIKNHLTGSAKPKNTIDLTNFSKIVFVVTASEDPFSGNKVGVTTDLTSEKYTFTASAAATVGTHEIDISAITGECRVMIMPYAHDPGGVYYKTAYITVSEVYLK